MIPMASWTPEFCTVCDKQCLLGTVYCSERCREADFHKTDILEPVGNTTNVILSISPAENETTDSSDEDDEVPNLWLNQSAASVEQKNSLAPIGGNPRKNAVRRKDSQFLYASPTLKPTKVSSASPVMSPLMIPLSKPSSVSSTHGDQISSQSVNTYKRWLAHGAA